MVRHRPSGLSDRELLTQIKRLVKTERTTTYEILVTLCEIERRKLHLRLGANSLFDYCTTQLGYSASAAGRRIQVARCIQKFAEVDKQLRNGKLNLTTVSLAAPILTAQNESEIIGQVSGKTQREVEEIVNRYRPPVRLRDRVKPVRVPVNPSTASRSQLGVDTSRNHSRSGSARASTTQQPQDQIESTPGAGVIPRIPPSERKLFVQFLAGEAFLVKFERVRALISNRKQNASFEDVFEIVLDEFLDRHAPENRVKRRATRRSKLSAPSPKPKRNEPKPPQDARHIPQAIRDKVFVRDHNRCTYVGTNGKRCVATRGLQIDHIQPFGRGGGNSIGNLQLLCAAHNQLEADRVYGADKLTRRRRRE